MIFSKFFEEATKHPPYAWQGRLACGENYRNDDLAVQTCNSCVSRLIDIPTGLGKTAGVVLAWLWNRLGQADETTRREWPRRLVYCLPMRTLVEQTEQEVRNWVHRLIAAKAIDFEPRVVVLMGGESPEGRDKDWDIYPEEPAILIGTQDMLLSRALNRGYGMSRYRWPMHFALLNNDALWVMDEVQLMGPGLASTTQLEGFRNVATELGSYGCRSWWMSATIRPDWLKAIDMSKGLLDKKPFQLSDEEKNDKGRVEALRTASKTVEKASVLSDSKNLKALANNIKETRSSNGLNLIVVNTVKRARELHEALKKLLKGQTENLLLLHSQFRPNDRQRVLDEIRQNPSDKIVVSTQVIEAGVDLSAHTLFTELAPWSSLVQRFGRCNRWLINDKHHYTDACIYWFDLPDEKDHLPYKSAALSAAKTRLEHLSDAAIQHLEAIDSPDEDRPEFRHVVRRKDLIDLFDTTSDLAGADLDIDRFIRDIEDSHVRVFWRDWADGSPNGKGKESLPEKAPQRDELCSVSIKDFRDFIKKHGPAWRWNGLDRIWQKVRSEEIYPGQIYLLHVNQGGYNQGDDTLPAGWNGNPKSKVDVIERAHSIDSVSAENDSYDGEPGSKRDQPQTIAEHTDAVCSKLNSIIGILRSELNIKQNNSNFTVSEILQHAARWHDWGKAHLAFQAKLKPDEVKSTIQKGPVAKAPENAWKKGRIPQKPNEDDSRRPHFRHELASALGVLLPDSGFPLTDNRINNFACDLAAYLIAAHHGKVRLSIRSMPNEQQPTKNENNAECRFARGVWDGDKLLDCDLGGDEAAQAVTLSLEPMELGLGEQEPFLDQPSWAERCLNLRDTLGPFRLAFLETILRAADARGSQV